MTERDLGNSISWWIGQVVNVNDPDQSGRVQIRVYGRHDDKTNIPDDALPWALPLQPVTSAAYGKLGTAPLGLVKGSKVMGFWMDQDQQYPVIWGSFGKAGDPVPGSTEGGTEKIDIKTGSIPTAAINQSDPVAQNPYALSSLFPARIDINKINNGDGSASIGKFDTKVGVVTTTKVDTKLKEPTKPTTASLKKSDKSDILDQITKVDPEKLSRSIPGMVDGYKTVRDIMSMTSPAGLTNLLSGGVSGMLSGLAGSLGIGGALALGQAMMSGGGLAGIAQNALKSGLADFALSAADSLASGGGLPISNVISSVIPQIDSVIGSPVASLISEVIPPTFVQQYFPLDSEPFPGYIQFKDIATGEIMYRLRGNEPHYDSPQAHIQGNAAHSMTQSITKVIEAHGIADAISGALSTGTIEGAITGGLSGVASGAVSSVLGGGLGSLAGGAVSSVLGGGGIADIAGGAVSSVLGGGLGGIAGGAVSSVLGGGLGGIAGDIGSVLSGGAASNLLGSLGGDALGALGGVISGGLGGVAAQGISSVLGSGVSLDNISGLADKLVPNLSGNIGGMLNSHLPASVLDAGKVGAAMGNFTKNQALLAQKKTAMKSALEPDIDSKLADAYKKLDASKNATNVTGTSEVINGVKVTYTATGAIVGG